MIHIDGLLYLEYEELVPNVIPEGTYNTMRTRDKFSVYGRGGNGSAVLIDYESLPEGYKEKVKVYYGDPYEYASKQPILDTIEPNPEARKYFQSIVLSNGNKLPSNSVGIDGKERINYVSRYTENVEWLDMLVRLTTDNATLKREFNMKIEAFYKVAASLVKVEMKSKESHLRLPASGDRLRREVSKYRKLGGENAWDSQVEYHRFGSNFSMKISSEISRNILKKMISEGHHDTIVATGYNFWAGSNNHQEITPDTVKNWRVRWDNELTLERDGIAEVNNKLSKKIKGKRPSAPLLLTNSDDNVWDVYFHVPEVREIIKGKEVVVQAENK